MHLYLFCINLIAFSRVISHARLTYHHMNDNYICVYTCQVQRTTTTSTWSSVECVKTVENYYAATAVRAHIIRIV